MDATKNREESSVRVVDFGRPRVSLHANTDTAQSWQDRILHKEVAQPGDKEQSSTQGYHSGDVPWPFDYEVARDFRTVNGHHSSCLAAKIQSTVGLGFKGPKRKATMQEAQDVAMGLQTQEQLDETLEEPSPAYEKLDPLTDCGFQDVLQDVAEDFVELGTGYFEVVRTRSGQVTGIHHLPAHHVRVHQEDRLNYHYVVTGGGLDHETKFDLRMARWGDSGFRERLAIPETEKVSEVVAVRQASTRSKRYGFPDWLAAVPSVELVQMHRQHVYDFFNNRGVPEFMLFILGKKLSDEDWDKVQQSVKAHVGLGNSYKSLALNLEGDPETLKIQLERLGLDGGASVEGQFQEIGDANGMDIVSAHRVPPLLAGIMIPGKLGASNELVNALLAFQTLVIGPFQTTFEHVLWNAFGAALGIERKDLKLKTILDKLDLGKMDTVSKMRQPLQQAQQEGRDLNSGTKK